MQNFVKQRRREILQEVYSSEILDAHENNEINLASRTPQGWYGYATPIGWAKLIQRLDAELNSIIPNYKLNQCKEKFGGLRYYVEFPEDISDEDYKKSNNLIHEAENQSNTLCTECGEQGQTREVSEYRIDTLCSMHANPEMMEKMRKAYDEAWKIVDNQ